MLLHNKTLIGGATIAGVSTIVGSSFGIHSALQDKTIRDRLITEGKQLIDNKDTDIFEIAFKERKNEAGFTTLISFSGNAIDNNTNLEKGGAALKKWCVDNLNLPLTEENIKKILDNVRKYCTLPMKTIGEKLKKEGKELAKDWSTKMKKINNSEKNPKLQEDLAIENASIKAMPYKNESSTHTVWSNALSQWCSNALNTSLTEDKDDTIFNKVKERCLEGE